MTAFRETLTQCELLDLGARGPLYTWNNGKEGEAFTQERLDRVVANSKWCEQFSDVEVLDEVAITSDHTPIIITISGEPQRKRPIRRFFYEAKWGVEKECKQIVKQVWREKHVQGDMWHKIQAKLEGCKRKLMQWQKKQKGIIEEVIGGKN